MQDKFLFFAAALVLVPGILLAAIAVRSGSESLEKVIGRELAREAGHTAKRISAVLRTERDTLASFARQDLMREVRVADIDKRISMALATLRSGNPARLDYLVVEPAGRVVAASDAEWIGRLPPERRAEWTATEGEPRFIGPAALSEPDVDALVMTTRIPDPDAPGRSLGSLVGLFDWGELTRVTAQVREELASEGIAADVLVVGSDLEVIGGARSPGSEGWAAGSGSLPEAVGAGHSVDADSGLIVGWAPLAPGLPDWRLLVVEPRAHALVPARQLSRRLMMTMGLAVGIALVLATLAARRVVGPLAELTRAIRGLPRGDAASRRVPVRTGDEVGTLASAFNEMAADLDRTQRELVEAEKFAFVGELAAGVAHEIRTSLGVLGSSAQMLERSYRDGPGGEAAELVQMMRAEVSRLEGVVSDLLHLDRDRPLQLERVALSGPVFRAADFVAPQAKERGVEILRSAAVREPEVECDPELVQQVAVGLLVNAIQALGPGGRVELAVLEEQEGWGGFEVRDDGPGVPEPLRERIFEPFVTARKGGIGLGLTFVKRVVHDHRGQVALESEPGEGTRVRVRLPVSQGER